MGMKLEINEILQWTGAVFIIAGHSLNAVGPAAYPYNILAFFLGTVLFMTWSIRVANKPQLLVNIVALAIGLTGLVKAFG
jgi:predicted membrane metal-binding protein